MAALGKLLGQQRHGHDHGRPVQVPVQAEATTVQEVQPAQVAYQARRMAEPWPHEPTLQQYLEGGLQFPLTKRPRLVIDPDDV